ncbi:MAG: carboxypeptidase M32 [Treponema sp.]|nr:carboxypeptidase M32 [Treponema sp.]
MDTKSKIEKLRALDREFRYLNKAIGVLQWDQETYLPESGVEERSEQLALLEGIAHEKQVDPQVAQLLNDLGSSSDNPQGDPKLDPLEQDYLRVLRRNYDKAVKLPVDFVSDAARAAGLSQAAWVKARQDNDFSVFLPHLSKMIDFARRRAAYWGYEKNPYDGLLDSFEPEMGTDAISAVFGPLGDRLSSLLQKIAARPRPDSSFLDRDFDTSTQAAFSREIMGKLGFDFGRGRVDVSAHPFSTTLGSHDVRITTRYLGRQVQSGIFSTIHELGHAFYELDLNPALGLTSLAEGASMGIHESQSRLWENVIGRSRPFWDYLYPSLVSHFPDHLKGISCETFYRAVNLAEPSFIRVEADEVSYSLHIIVRFQLERDLFQGSLRAEDLGQAWKDKMKQYLGIVPETDAQGVLQDIHWSMGAFGYFPSYALGNLYGLQFWAKMQEDLPKVQTLIGEGNFSPIRSWLRDHIAVHGARLPPQELLKSLTGQELSAEPFLSYIESKYSELYGL